jgi:hypothetical protein
MADVDLFGNPINPFGASSGPGTTAADAPVVPPTTTTTTSGGGNARDAMIARDSNDWLNNLRGTAQGLGFSDWEQKAKDALGDVTNQVGYAQNAGKDPATFIADAVAKMKQQAASNGGGATGGAGGGVRAPGGQFTDPYTSYLEDMAKRNIGRLQNSPELSQLMGFLNKQFAELSQSNGFTPAELGALRTQAIEPINQQRDAAQQRALERTAARGYLPSSGLAQSEAGDIDRAFAQMQTAAQRDLAIQNINQRQTQLNNALNLGQLALQIPQNQDAQALNIAQLLYQLPRNAMQDSLAVINASNPNAALASVLGAQNQAFNQNAYNQQAQQQLWALLGQLFGTTVGGR